MLKTDKTTYISVDVETTGPVPGLHSMISLGGAAFNREGVLLDKILINFDELPWSKQDPDTMRFWTENPIAYARTKEFPKSAIEGSKEFVVWYQKFENPTFVFMPAKFDLLFVYWYIETFVTGLGFANTPHCVDVSTLAMLALGVENPILAAKRYWPKRWKNKSIKHNHVAVDDAVEQGEQFFKIFNELQEAVRKGSAPTE